MIVPLYPTERPRRRRTRRPRSGWVRMLIVVGASLVLLMLALHLTAHAPIGHGITHHAPGASTGLKGP